MSGRCDVIFLNGGSSSGKTGIARCLQAILSRPWLRTGLDVLFDTMPTRLYGVNEGIRFLSDGRIEAGPGFLQVHGAWRAGVAATVRAGVPMIVDEVFLRGAADQVDWQRALSGLRIMWVGVKCAAETAEGRELARGDRTLGMARAQAAVVHVGVNYDLAVDTTDAEALECAQQIAAELSAMPRQA